MKVFTTLKNMENFNKQIMSITFWNKWTCRKPSRYRTRYQLGQIKEWMKQLKK